MRIKIDDVWYDSQHHPIGIVFDETDRTKIASMPLDHYRYARFPEDIEWTTEERLRWLKDDTTPTEAAIYDTVGDTPDD